MCADSCSHVAAKMASDDKKELAIKIVYFAGIALASVLFGFKRTIKDASSSDAKLHNEAVSLARKALARGTMYSVGGFALLTTTSYYLFGRRMISEFNERYKTPTDEKEVLDLLESS